MAGSRGPRRIPTKLLAATGSTLAPQRSNEIAPPVEMHVPPPPSWVSEAARKHWQPLCAELIQMGLLTTLDHLAAAMLIEALAKYIDSRDEFERTGLIVKSVRGTTENPASKAMDREWANVMRALREFGLSPSARSGLTIPLNPNQPGVMTARKRA
jgi:P27 family predicted phage terminase small subunit